MLKIQTTQLTRFRIADSITLDSGVKIPLIQGQVSSVDVKSQKGYRYRKGFWNKVLDDDVVRTMIEKRESLGMIEHPTDDFEYMDTPYDKAAVAVFKAWVDDSGNPFAQLGILNNEHGNKVKALLDIGHQPGVSTRGLGLFAVDDEGEYIDEENYIFRTWDIVRSPNFADLKMDKVTDSVMASPQFKELVQLHHLKDSVDEHYSLKNLLKEQANLISQLNEITKKLKRYG